MKNVFLIILLSLLNFNTNGNSKTIEIKESVDMIEMTVDTVNVYADVKPVQHLLDIVPEDEQYEFVEVLRDFASKRGFDWRLCLLVLYQESGLKTDMVGIYQPSFVGIAMFGYYARKELGVSRSEILKMNHIEQAKLAVSMWESNEKQRNTQIDGFLLLHVANFYPAWMPYAKKGGILPSTKKAKKQNKPLLMGQKEFTRDGLLNFYRKKVQSAPELSWFIGKV